MAYSSSRPCKQRSVLYMRTTPAIDAAIYPRLAAQLPCLLTEILSARLKPGLVMEAAAARPQAHTAVPAPPMQTDAACNDQAAGGPTRRPERGRLRTSTFPPRATQLVPQAAPAPRQQPPTERHPAAAMGGPPPAKRSHPTSTLPLPALAASAVCCFFLFLRPPAGGAGAPTANSTAADDTCAGNPFLAPYTPSDLAALERRTRAFLSDMYGATAALYDSLVSCPDEGKGHPTACPVAEPAGPHAQYSLIKPTMDCRDQAYFGAQAGDGRKAVCSPERLAESCVIYSLGSNNDFSFEEDVLRRTPCEVMMVMIMVRSCRSSAAIGPARAHSSGAPLSQPSRCTRSTALLAASPASSSRGCTSTTGASRGAPPVTAGT